MLFHELGKDSVAALELGFELLDLLVLGAVDSLGLTAILERGMAVLEELLEPVIDEGCLDVEFIAEIGNGHLVDEMPLENGDLLGGLEMPTLLAHDEPPQGLS